MAGSIPGGGGRRQRPLEPEGFPGVLLVAFLFNGRWLITVQITICETRARAANLQIISLTFSRTQKTKKIVRKPTFSSRKQKNHRKQFKKKQKTMFSKSFWWGCPYQASLPKTFWKHVFFVFFFFYKVFLMFFLFSMWKLWFSCIFLFSVWKQWFSCRFLGFLFEKLQFSYSFLCFLFENFSFLAVLVVFLFDFFCAV